MNGKAFAFALAVSGATAFCSVSASSMDGAPLASSKRDLLGRSLPLHSQDRRRRGRERPDDGLRARGKVTIV